MSWVCEFCSTVNEEDDRVCFACDQERSAADIERARYKERIKRIKGRFLLAYNVMFNIAKYLFWISTVILSVMLTIILILKITGEQTGSIFGTLLEMVLKCKTNIFTVFSNTSLIANNIVYIIIDLYKNRVVIIATNAIGNVKEAGDVLMYAFTTNLKQKVDYIVTVATPAVYHEVYDNLLVFVHALKKIFVLVSGK